MNVQESIEAVKDGTFETKVKDLSTARAKAAETKAISSVRNGHALYNSLHTTKED